MERTKEAENLTAAARLVREMMRPDWEVQVMDRLEASWRVPMNGRALMVEMFADRPTDHDRGGTDLPDCSLRVNVIGSNEYWTVHMSNPTAYMLAAALCAMADDARVRDELWWKWTRHSR